MLETLFLGVLIVPFLLFLVFVAFPALILAGIGFLGGGVYFAIVHPHWWPVWGFCFFWAFACWALAAAIHDDFLKGLTTEKPTPAEALPVRVTHPEEKRQTRVAFMVISVIAVLIVAFLLGTARFGW